MYSPERYDILSYKYSGVVFMTFWQKMMLSLVVNLGFPDKFDSQEDANDFSESTETPP